MVKVTERTAGQQQPSSVRPLVSVVAPCYNEELVITEFHRRASAACRVAVGDSYELLFVDDGSRDATWQKICDLTASDPNVVGVRLFRNHGHQLAVTAGLSVTQGERVLLIDADLQDPPELLSQMMALMDQGADVVYGTRSARKGETVFKLATATLFYRLLNSLSGVRIPRDTGDFRLMRRAVVEILNSMPEQHRFIRGMVSWIGGKQIAFPYERDIRFAGTTKYPLGKMIRFAVDGITSFSTIPLMIAVWLGLASGAVSFLVLGYALLEWARGNVVPGWASSLVASAFFSGIQLLVLGVIGEYLGRIMEETKRRPLFVIGTLRRQGSDYALPANFYRMEPSEQQSLCRAESPQR